MKFRFRKQINLNNNQKQFLIDNEYVTSKMLYSPTYKGWEKYFIDNFDWKLDTKQNVYNMNNLLLVNKEESITYRPMVNLQGDDFNNLLKVK